MTPSCFCLSLIYKTDFFYKKKNLFIDVHTPFSSPYYCLLFGSLFVICGKHKMLLNSQKNRFKSLQKTDFRGSNQT